MTEIDHLVYLAPDLDAAIDRLEELLGVRAAPGGRHARWGTRNALLALGPRTYFEILGPDSDRAPESRPGFGLATLAEPRLALWAIPAADLEARVVEARRGGVELGEVFDGSREKPDGTVLSWRFTDPERVVGDGLVPFLIDWGGSEHPAAGAPPGLSLERLRAEHPDPDRIRLLLEAVGAPIPVSYGREPRLIATVGSPNGEIELR